MSDTGYTLTWKRDIKGPMPVDGSFLRADALGTLDPDSLRRVAIRIGRDTVTLDDCFEVTGTPGPRVVVRSIPPLDRIGAAMAGGELIIDGDVGDDLAASMTGGTIRVTGSAGDRVGGPLPTSGRGMNGGEVFIRGDAGDFVGLRMRRGLIAVGGSAKRSPGYRMLAGTIIVGRGPHDHPGLEMRRGTLVLLAPKTPWTPDAAGSTFAKEGDFDAPASLRLLLRHAAARGAAVDPACINGRFTLYSGDRFELNKGEVWQWLS